MITPVGTHWIIDLVDLPPEACLDGAAWVKVFVDSAKLVGVKVISTAFNDFQPPAEPGTTAYVLLDSSHFSVHTYANFKMAALDLFTCSDEDLEKAVVMIKNHFKLSDANIDDIKKIARFRNAALVRCI